jgi:hypothetical protein
MAPHARSWFRQIAPLAVVTFLLLPPAARAAFEKRLTVEANSLELFDLIGEVRVERASGTAFEIVVSVDGRDATEERVTLEQKPGDPARVLVRFPTEKEHDFVYPRLGAGSNTNFSISGLAGENQNLLEWLLRGRDDQIHVRGSGRGLELWADVTIRVPAGKKTDARVGVGSLEATGTVGDLALDSASGSITVTDVQGAVVLDTGSGSVEATGVKGDLSVDTGSGNVELGDVAAGDLHVDTGSGNVRATGLGVDSALVDTGSGNVRLALSRMGSGRFRIDTGSGQVEMSLPAAAEATVHADTGSGSIRYESADENLSGKDELDFRIGKGGAEIEIDTGSGSILIRQ